MAKRSYNRRSDDKVIGDLQAKIDRIEARLVARQRKDSPVLKEIPKVKRQLAKFAQLCMDHDRKDLANTVMAFLSTIDVQARQSPEGSNARGHLHEEQVEV